MSVRPDQQRRLYSLCPEPFKRIDSWMDDYRQLWDGRLDRLAAQLETRARRKKPR